MGIADRIGIRWGITVSFLLIIIILVLFGLYTLSGMHTLGNLTATLHRHPLRVSNAALSAQSGILRIHRDMKDVVLSDNPHDLQQILQRVQEEERHVYTQLAEVRQYILGEEGQRLVADSTKAFSAWKAIRDRVVFLVRNGDRAGATKITREDGADHVRLLERKMEVLTSYARNKADGFMANALEVQKRIGDKTLFILLFLVLLLCGFWLVMRRITGRLAQLQKTLAELDESGELVEVDVQGNNEIADLGRTFNALIRDLRHRIWVREGLTRLSENLMTVRSLDDFDSTLGFLARYVDASASALFSFDSRTDRLHLMATYALPRNFTPECGICLGQGVVGQAAKDRQPIYLTEVPDKNMQSESGTGEMTPKAVFVIPLVFKSEMVGVVEFAFMFDIRDVDREFLTFGGNLLAGAILSVVSRMEVDRLFSEANATNTMLGEKSRELEKVNETLSMRNEELDAQSRELETKTEDLSNLAAQLSAQKRQLEIKQRQAEESDRLKSEFLSNMSHELRTPLNSILALSQLMLRRKKYSVSEKETEYIRVIERNGRHLLALINNILDLSKIESGRVDVSMSEFDPAKVVAEVMEIMQPLARDKGLGLNPDVDFTGTIVSDRDKVLQVLLNLVSNAVKFTESGSIDLRLTGNAGEVRFLVIDTGIGIPAGLIDAVFDQFKQVDGSTTRRHDGSGLGLTISREFARLLGGDLWADSVPGQGSCFTMSLPRVGAGKPVLRDRATPRAPEPPGNRDRTVLVVDDVPHHRQLIREILEGSGYAVIECDNGADALEIAATRSPDAITLDVFMPGMDGWEVLCKLKERPQTAGIPVMIVSISPDRVTAMALGADSYLPKPLDRNQLLPALERLGGVKDIRLVLAVDDEEAVREQLRKLLEAEGYEVAVADDGNKGLALARSLHPDIILLDLYMPGMDGFTLLSELRNDPKLMEVPVIIVTSRDLSPEDRAELMPEACRILSKGHPLNDVLQTIRDELGKLDRNGPAGKPAVQWEREKTTVLAVEDNEANVMVLKEVLQDSPWELIVATDGERGIEMARSEHPDLILMDVHLPGISGVDATRMLKADPDTRDIAVIALTARSMTGDRERFLDAGCDDYLAKPYDPDQLLECIGRWLRKGKCGCVKDR